MWLIAINRLTALHLSKVMFFKYHTYIYTDTHTHTRTHTHTHTHTHIGIPCFMRTFPRHRGGQSTQVHYLSESTDTTGARFNKEVQPTRSLNLNSELTYSEMGNSEFSGSERLNCVSLLKVGWLWVYEKSWSVELRNYDSPWQQLPPKRRQCAYFRQCVTLILNNCQ